MRAIGVARGNIGSRARCSAKLPALCWLAGVCCVACGAGAGSGEEEGAAASVNALSASDASNTADAADTVGADRAGSAVPAAAAASPAPSAAPIPTPPSEEPSALPHAALDTSRGLDRLAPAEVVIEPGECRFEFLGESVRCQNAGAPQRLATDAPDLVTCMRQCLEREDCTAVTDFLWLGEPGLGCYLYLSACDEPALASPAADDDGGRDFRRRCSDTSTG